MKLKSLLKETNIKLDDQGYAQDYHNIKSNLVDTWTDTNTVKADIKGYLELAHESGGPKQMEEVMKAMLEAIKETRKLLFVVR